MTVEARSIVTIEADTTRADLAVTLDILNCEAKAMRRRGYVGTASTDYAVTHDRINAVLEDYWDAPA